MYSTVFNPHVYPMNPSWITGTMPEEMYHHEHPGHLEEAKRETEALIQAQIAKVSGDRKPAQKELGEDVETEPRGRDEELTSRRGGARRWSGSGAQTVALARSRFRARFRAWEAR